MKKLNLLVLPLMAISFLTNCGGGSTPTEDVKFSIQESSVTLKEDNTIKLHLSWEPSSDIIEFSNFTFTLDSGSTTATVTSGTVGDRPLELTVTFATALSTNDKGDLKFHYSDKTTKKEGESKVNDININVEGEKPIFSVTDSTVDYDDYTNSAVVELNWKPASDSITFSNLDFAYGEKHADEVTAEATTSSPANIYIQFGEAGLDEDVTGTLSFAYKDNTTKVTGTDKIENITINVDDPVDESWTLTLDDNSKNFGDLSYGEDSHEQKGDSITIYDFIGTTSATIVFVPEDRYTGAVFSITASDKKGSTFTVDYTPPEGFEDDATIIISSDKQFEKDDAIVLSFEPKTWTAKLDEDSQKFGNLSYGGQEKTSIDVMEYIDSNSAVLSFIPNDSSINYTITAKDAQLNELDASYAAGSTASITLTKKGADTFKENDEITLHLEEPKPSSYLIKFSGTNCVMKDESGNLITESGKQINAGETYFRFEGNKESNTEYLLPTRSQVSIIYTDTNVVYNDWTYRPGIGFICVNVAANLTITATADADPGIPVEEGKNTLYFKLNSGSKETKNYESIFFTGDIINWASGNKALAFTRVGATDFYYLSISTATFIDDTTQYQLVKGYNATSGKPEAEQGLKWSNVYKSVECRKENQPFDYSSDVQKISLDVHTFDTNLVNPTALPLTNCTLSVTFADKVEEGYPVLPDDYTVLIFGSMNGWVTPGDDLEEEARRQIISNSTMTRKEDDNLTLTFTYDTLYPGTYDFQICTELTTYLEEEGRITWHKIKEGLDVGEANNILFTIDESEAGKADVTIDILGEGNKAHFVQTAV